MHTQLFVAALILGAPAHLLEQQAPTCPLGTRLSLHVSSSTNATGHEVHEMKIAQPADDSPWSVQVAVEAPICQTALNPLKHTTITLSRKTIPTPQAAKPIPEHYKLIPEVGGVYKFHGASQIWLDANKTCTSEGAHLAIPESAEEITALVGLYAEHRSEVAGDESWGFVLIGIHDIDHEGKWTTVFGEPVKYQKWAAGEPSSGTAENCGSISKADGGLNDYPCGTHKAPFICQLHR